MISITDDVLRREIRELERQLARAREDFDKHQRKLEGFVDESEAYQHRGGFFKLLEEDPALANKHRIKLEQLYSKRARENLNRLEQYHEELTRDHEYTLQSTASFKTVDEAISELRCQITLLSNAGHVPGGDKLSSAFQQAREHLKPEEKIIADASSALLGMFTSAVASLAPDRKGESVKLYKLALILRALQKKRADLFQDFLRKAETWDEHEISSELYRRRTEMAALETAKFGFYGSLTGFTGDRLPNIDPFPEERRFLLYEIEQLKAISRRRGGRAHLGDLSPDSLEIEKRKELLIKEVVEIAAPKSKRSEADLLREHVDNVVTTLDTVISLQEAGAELRKRYDDKYHWYIDEEIRRKIDDLQEP
jgi:flagellar biosynthesis chaperone FliJ